ncbi:MAG TPA: TonB-dependent receptor, partial [Vicinamibacteria bacterium]
MFALAVWLTLTTAAAAAPNVTSVSGRIVSRTGEPLPGVVVTLSGEAAKFSMVRVTGGDGGFLFRDVPKGSYRVVASLPRYEEAIVEAIVVDGSEIRLDIPLSLPQFAETVEIRATAPGEADDNPAPPEKLEIRQLDLLPLATDRFQDAFPLLPGVVRDPEGKLSFNGSRPSQSILLVNGANVTDPVTGDFAVQLPLSAIEEVEVNSIPYSAQYGRVTAAVAEIRTRGGTDEWDIDTGDLLPKPNFRDGGIHGIRSFVPQFSVSGPLEKGKLWFSQGLAYRYVRSRAYDVESGEDERVLESYDSFTQLDWRIAKEHELTTTFSYFPSETDNLGLNALTTSEATPEFHSWGWNGAVSSRSTFARSLVESTVAVKHYDLSLRPKSRGTSRLTPEGLRDNYFHNLERGTSRLDLLLSFTRSLQGPFGEHVLKAGGSYGRSRFDEFDLGLPVDLVDASGRLVRRIEFQGDPEVEGTDVETSLYLQDRFRIGSRLGLEVGLRYDYDRLVDSRKLGPRFAAAWAVDSSGLTVLRGGLGLFHDHVFLNAGSFQDFQQRVETSFGEDGTSGPPIVFENRADPDELEAPRSTTWNVELDRRLTDSLAVQVGYRERHGSQEFLVDRLVEGDRGTLRLSSEGKSVNRELGVTFRLSRG